MFYVKYINEYNTTQYIVYIKYINEYNTTQYIVLY